VSFLAFYLKNNVPSDPVETLLTLQGVDESKEEYPEAYEIKAEELGMHLPTFYFSVQSDFTSWMYGYNGGNLEKRFASDLSLFKYRKEYILELLSIISELGSLEKRHILVCQVPYEIIEKLDRPQLVGVSNTHKIRLIDLVDRMEQDKVLWHHPVVMIHGIENQYHQWASGFLSGDFGVSLVDAQPVFSKVWDSMKWTLMLVFLSLFFAIVASFGIGVYNGVHQDSRFDRWSNALLFVFYSIPKFWLATLMIIFFTTSEYGQWTNIFPSVGFWPRMTGVFEMIYSSWDKLILPLLVIVIPDVAYLSRLIRASIIEENNKDYIKTARSKGVSKRRILSQHLIPNSLVPTITLFAGVLPGALGSSLIIEVIFNMPGIGRLMYDSIKSADWAIVFPIIMIVSIFTVIIFLRAFYSSGFLSHYVHPS